jgi:lysozyme family protein
MADINKYFPKLIAFEGGFVNNPSDRGKATNMGITLSTWKSMGYDKNSDGIIDVQDIELLTRDDVLMVLRKTFWDKWQADLIGNQSIAEMLVDWTWCSGKWGIIWPQRLLGIKADGIVGNYTLASVNSASSAEFHAKVLFARVAFAQEICQRDPSQAVFLKGWLNRIQSFKFKG